jgi:hypothetical protein
MKAGERYQYRHTYAQKKAECQNKNYSSFSPHFLSGKYLISQ